MCIEREIYIYISGARASREEGPADSPREATCPYKYNKIFI